LVYAYSPLHSRRSPAFESSAPALELDRRALTLRQLQAFKELLLKNAHGAGIRRVKGAKRLGVPVGNWLTAEQGKRLLSTADSASLRGKRDYAVLAILLGCGLRRGGVAATCPAHRVACASVRTPDDARVLS
jgi:integrase